MTTTGSTCPRCSRASAAPSGSAVRCEGCGAHFWAAGDGRPGEAFALDVRPPGALESLWAATAATLLLAAFVALLSAEAALLVLGARWIFGPR